MTFECQCQEQTTLRRPPRTDKEKTQTRNKSRRNTGNGVRADSRKTEIEKEPFANQKQNAEKLEGQQGPEEGQKVRRRPESQKKARKPEEGQKAGRQNNPPRRCGQNNPQRRELVNNTK